MTHIARVLQKDFEIDDLLIARRDSLIKPPVPEQLCLQFDLDHLYRSATVTITPSKDRIILTAVILAASKAS